MPLLRLARKHVDIPAVLAGCIPFVHAANVAAQIYDQAAFKGKTLQSLPQHPRFCLSFDEPAKPGAVAFRARLHG
ncbi:hypothetical protein ACVW1A_002775 [Bradyrhizobium sp. LB1.3]